LTGVIVRPKRDAGAIFGAGRLDDAEKFATPQVDDILEFLPRASDRRRVVASPQERDGRHLSLDPRRTHHAARLQVLVSTPLG
jgi:hypothetical protein